MIQRGAADGLTTLAPTGDPAYAGLRGDLAADLLDRPKLGDMFALHPALAQVSALYGAKQALFAHAVASPYRDRSHFDAQNVLETGGAVAAHFALDPALAVPRLFPGSTGGGKRPDPGIAAQQWLPNAPARAT